MKFGLRNITRLLSNLGNPQRSYPSIHVAGSNGKGTSAALIASALSASGYRTGLYSSPHVLDFTERIRVDGRPISRRQLASILNVIRSDIVRHRATFFEAATALAFEHFRRCAVDVAVLEVGLGGRLDATNVVRPIVSVITSIAREHEAILGRGIVRIAREKGGIIKPRVPVVVGDVGRPADRVLRRIAKQRSAPYYDLTGASARIREESLAGTRFALRGIDGMEGEYRLGLVGKHQVRNAVLVLRVLAEVQRRSRFAIGTNAVEKAFSDYERLSGLGARFQVLGELVARAKRACRFDDVVDSEFAPGQFPWVPYGEHPHGLVSGAQHVSLRLDRFRKRTHDRVVPEEVGQGLVVREVLGAARSLTAASLGGAAAVAGHPGLHRRGAGRSDRAARAGRLRHIGGAARGGASGARR